MNPEKNLKQNQNLKAFVIKYDYEDMYGFGSIIVFASDMECAVKSFCKYMYDKNDSKWLERTIHNNAFRWVSSNVFGWNTYFNLAANVCIKVREVSQQFGDIIPIQEHFEKSDM